MELRFFEETRFLAKVVHEPKKPAETAGFDEWLEDAGQSEFAKLRNFASGLRRDYQAVKAAFDSDWSNGQVEGQVNRLKTIKRQMYGRAKFDLLRARVLGPP